MALGVGWRHGAFGRVEGESNTEGQGRDGTDMGMILLLPFADGGDAWIKTMGSWTPTTNNNERRQLA